MDEVINQLLDNQTVYSRWQTTDETDFISKIRPSPTAKFIADKINRQNRPFYRLLST